MDFVRQNRPIGLNAPLVVSETIEQETILLHHGTGNYFNTTGAGATICEALAATATLDDVVSRLNQTYDIDGAAAREAALRFLDLLAAHDLIAPGNGVNGLPAISAPAVRPPFVEPELGVHTDLADMLLLDPIHDVDEAGWPAPATL